MNHSDLRATRALMDHRYAKAAVKGVQKPRRRPDFGWLSRAWLGLTARERVPSPPRPA